MKYFLLLFFLFGFSSSALAVDYPYSNPGKPCLKWRDAGKQVRKIWNGCNHGVTIKVDLRGAICNDDWIEVPSNDFYTYTNKKGHCKIYAFEIH